jgi:hypothetical protein
MGFFRALKRVMTGEVIENIDTPANGGMVSLRLKRERGSGEDYVVLVLTFQYIVFDKDQFHRFSQAVESIRTRQGVIPIGQSQPFGVPNLAKLLKMVMTGREVIEKIDTPASGVTVSLRLMRGSGEDYVVLVLVTALGGQQYIPFGKDEFGPFSQAVESIRTRLGQNPQPET